MRFLVFADLHLDGHVDAWGCLDRLLAVAATEQVDAILSAGGLYEHGTVAAADTGHRLAERFARAGCTVFLAPGGEDPHLPDSVYATTDWPANVHVFDDDLLVPVDLDEGFRLWGAAHRRGHGTEGFLDGFRISDDAVNLALFHGSEVGWRLDGTTRVVAPFRAEQVREAGLDHAFVGHGHAPVDGPWHTSPGSPHVAPGHPDGEAAGGAVVVDVARDGTLRRQRHTLAAPRVHQVALDAADAPSTGLDLPTIEAHLEALRAPRMTLEAALADEVQRPEAPAPSGGSVGRTVARAVAALVAVSSAVGLLVIGDSFLERGVALAALAVLVVVGLSSRRGPSVDVEVEAERARARAALLRGMEHNAEVERALHAAVTALRQAGLPTDPDELAERVHGCRARQG